MFFPLLLAALPAAAHFDTTSRHAPDSTERAPVHAPARGGGGEPVADSIVVEKGQHLLTLYAGGQPLRSYHIALGAHPVGAKQRQGDMRTPEGLYRIDHRNPHSRYHLALHISYPSASDLARAHSEHVLPGGDVMIHGLPNGEGYVGAAHRKFDWTNGCIAVTDEEIEEIWRAVPDGAPIEIKP